ncbi:Ig-like domain-containing protein [Solirubrobacter phytolaccae]|uniref:Ig-like domain-containing protein n=1 Tax=Solirubrobacter phytolaccae TaxID=1404360 RepID=A0A9X3NBC9_9ACTN|nr:Ig-like domain-containing protein [Solirubrobacter phytolaccae]MDA0181800.1 Ig-like domain-containing protein [Solirubrobacter phytolaccae]
MAVAALVLPTTAQAATPTTTTLTPNLPTSYFGEDDLRFTAKVTGTNGVPTGAVAFAINGTTYGLPVPLNGLGEAVDELELYVGPGDKVTAFYLGDANNQASSGEATPTILPAKTRVTVVSSPSPSDQGKPVKIDVGVINTSSDAPPSGGVTLFVDGASAAGPFPLGQDGTVTIIGGAALAAGAHTFEARYSDTDPVVFEPSAGSTTHTVTAPPVPPPPVVNPIPQQRINPVTQPPYAVLRSTTTRTGAISLLTQLPAAGTVTAHASASGVTKYGTASKVTTAAERVTLVINPSAKAKRKLAKGKSVKVTVKLRFQPATGGAAKTITRRVTVKATKTARVAKGSRAPSPGSWRLASPSAGLR